ncbi:hypothetical protein WICPIJ_002110 [Wickerhamomyces pijperi]|uniref:Enoyl reductase (ER) domain-containing protein n=1 Tax=Wickerhamomyces pijperi TaxID=599730 RepID=A0A9P8QAF8_WICPI|nr:hypothetical protein WICPIJ_002110 [Wickerhamomyces pijperi]
MSENTITFKELVYHYKQPLTLEESSINLDDLSENEIVVKIASAAINPVDLVLFNTHPYVFFSRSKKLFGRDFSGVIVAKGSSVTKFEVQDKISGILDAEIYQTKAGSYSEYVKIDVTKYQNIGKKPNNLTMNEAASFNLVLGTAWTLFTHHHKPTENTRALVIGGATSVGNYAIQLLRQYYNVKSIISVNSTKSADYCKEAGADFIVDYTKGDSPGQVAKIIEEEFQGEKLDIIVDCVGGNEFFSTIDQCLKPKTENSGYVTIAGDEVYDYSKPLNPFKMGGVFKRFIFPKCFNYAFSAIDHGTWYDVLAKYFEEGKLKVNINKVVTGLENFQETIDIIIDHKSQGKVVLEIDSEL